MVKIICDKCGKEVENIYQFHFSERDAEKVRNRFLKSSQKLEKSMDEKEYFLNDNDILNNKISEIDLCYNCISEISKIIIDK
jgi:hypothetical protein